MKYFQAAFFKTKSGDLTMTFMKNKPKPQAVTEAGVYPTQAAALRLVDRLMSGSVRAASVSRCAEGWAVRVVRI